MSTTPTISTRASIVTLLSVKPNNFMNAKVAISEAGIATAAISVERHDFMNNSTVMLARMPPEQIPPRTVCSLPVIRSTPSSASRIAVA